MISRDEFQAYAAPSNIWSPLEQAFFSEAAHGRLQLTGRSGSGGDGLARLRERLQDLALFLSQSLLHWFGSGTPSWPSGWG